MQRFFLILIVLFASTVLFVSPAFSWFWDKPLVSLDETNYTAEDFKRWWGFWNDQDLAVPETVDPYVEWLLLANEGKRMELDLEPAFQRKTHIFVQVRSLLLLQKEEVYDRVKVSEAELADLYQKSYTPRWKLQKLVFKDEETAKVTRQELADGTLTVEELRKRSPDEGGLTDFYEDWQRPADIHEEWTNIFRPLAVGETTEPIVYETDVLVYRLAEKKGGDSEDFAALRKSLSDKIEVEQRSLLSLELVNKLKQKFNVEVDQERLDSLSLETADDAYSDAPIITTNRQNISEKQFMEILRRGAPTSGHKLDQQAEKKLKEETLGGILNQNLVDWEALDRHYELEEPLKWVFQFNVKHRLVKGVEQRFFVLQNPITDEEVENDYQENISRYTQPALVNFSIIEDQDGVVDLIWQDVLTGKSFAEAVLEHTRKADAPKTFPYSHLDPSIKVMIDKLANGETSRPFIGEGNRYIVHLVNRTPAKPLPLAQVADRIRSQLEKDKTSRLRSEYLQQLKTRSKIEINDSAWQEVKVELGEDK